MKLQIAFKDGRIETSSHKDENEAREYLRTINQDSIIYFDVLKDDGGLDLNSKLLHEAYPKPISEQLD